jgi:hypothetical protein
VTFTNGATGTVVVESDRRGVRITRGEGRGTAILTYTVIDADGGESAPAAVTVIGRPVNQSPTANDQSVAVSVGVESALPLDVADPDGGTLSVVDLDDPSGVVATTVGTSLVVRASEPGSFVVTYRVTDGELFSRTATVTVVAA